MGQSLSNLCGIKPAEPKQWPAFEAKMKAEGLSDAAIASFKHNFVTLASGANLMISEAPPRVKPGAGRPPASCPSADASVRLGSAIAASAVQFMCRAHAARAPTRAHHGRALLGPARLGLPQPVFVLLTTHAHARADCPPTELPTDYPRQWNISPVSSLPDYEKLTAEDPSLLSKTVMLKLNGGLGTGMGAASTARRRSPTGSVQSRLPSSAPTVTPPQGAPAGSGLRGTS